MFHVVILRKIWKLMLMTEICGIENPSSHLSFRIELWKKRKEIVTLSWWFILLYLYRWLQVLVPEENIWYRMHLLALNYLFFSFLPSKSNWVKVEHLFLPSQQFCLHLRIFHPESRLHILPFLCEFSNRVYTHCVTKQLQEPRKNRVEMG